LSENKALWKIFGPKRYEVTGVWRKLHKEEVHYLYFSSNIFRVIKSRMERVGHVVRIGERRGANRILVWKPEGKRNLESLGVDGIIILKRIARKSVGKAWIGSMWLSIGASGGLL
jgi:hypothetical protein